MKLAATVLALTVSATFAAPNPDPGPGLHVYFNVDVGGSAGLNGGDSGGYYGGDSGDLNGADSGDLNGGDSGDLNGGDSGDLNDGDSGDLTTDLIDETSTEEATTEADTTVAAGITCPDMAVAITGKCVIFGTSPQTWWNVQEACIPGTRDAVLIKLDSMEFWRDLAQYLLDRADNNDYWTGGRYIGSGGHWLWLDGAPFATMETTWGEGWWHPGQPSGELGEVCAGLRADDGFAMHDYFCTEENNSLLYALCEIAALEP